MTMHKTLSTRQPWAWLICAGHKPIENRAWSTRYRGPLLIQATARMSLREATLIERAFRVPIDRDALTRGAIVGIVELVDVVRDHPSRWFEGPFGWVLRNARLLRPVPCRGERGHLFEASHPDV